MRQSHASSDVATKQDIADLRRDTKQDIAELRKDLSAVEERTDAKLDKLRSDLRHEISDLRKNMDAKFAGMDARFEKRLLILGVTLASITLFGKDTLSALLRLFH